MQVGVLHKRDKKGCIWEVVWSNGTTGTYFTGGHNVFELCHVEVCDGSGAPVMWTNQSHGDDKQLRQAVEVGAAVVRGAQWAARDGAPRAECGRLKKVETSGNGKLAGAS